MIQGTPIKLHGQRTRGSHPLELGTSQVKAFPSAQQRSAGLGGEHGQGVVFGSEPPLTPHGGASPAKVSGSAESRLAASGDETSLKDASLICAAVSVPHPQARNPHDVIEMPSQT